ncbi:Acetoacetyl-CoA synthetase [Rhodococcus wratislaviensis]|uniref:Acetoacetyl-CoA synthetase n=1 Tax=Rhodococcus wratislaviensis TaxID=44752 RepID=A0A402CCD9_RHOWR|nr:AMP-binding protein [Rhodococcus wratislaviensis]GCE41258.1 Acetoacetyl-CoA synthetase [Rhodococcus wratislaviensis]
MPLEKSLWPATPSSGVRDITVGDLLREAASAVPDRLALVDGSPDPADRREWTYRQLLADTEQAARALLAHFARGDRIAIWAPNSAEWVILQQAIAMAGMVVVGVNPAYRAHELEYILRQSRSVGLFYRESYRGADLTAVLAEVRPSLPELRMVVTPSEWQSFIATADPAIDLPAVTPTAPVQIQYTSGTTGFPKGALLHHKGIVNEATFVFERAGLVDHVVCVNAMPMYHIGGGAVTELGTFAAHGTFVVLPGFDAALMLEMLESYRGTHSLMVPTMLIALLEHPDRETRDLSSLHTVLSGASAVPQALVERVLDELACQVTILFGQSEMHGVISQTRVTDDPADQATTVGQPLPELEVKIIDPVSQEIVPIGEQGEICCRGYQTMLGYSEMPDETAAAIDADGWLYMGDLATMDERGFLRITGRLKDMIIRGGMNIYPREIEELLFRHDDVAEVAIVGVPDTRWGEQIGAVVRPADPANPPDPTELKAWCRDRIAAHKTPSLWYFTDTLPMTPSGKIQKFRVQQEIASGALTAADLDTQPAPESLSNS